MSHKPLISIITVVYNGKETIRKTIESVITQPYENIEYIIIDGDSTDGTQEVIGAYSNEIDHWVSESDKGIYDAMNKGIDVAKGDGLLFINSGDYIVGNVFTDALPIPCFLPVRYQNYLRKMVSEKIGSHKSGLPYNHQGIVFENKGLYYNTEFNIASDYDFFLRHGYDNTLPVYEADGYIYYDNSGFSAANYRKRDEEIAEIIKLNFGTFWKYLFQTESFFKSALKEFLNVNN